MGIPDRARSAPARVVPASSPTARLALGLTPGPQAVTASPAARMLVAALRSRSWTVPQSGEGPARDLQGFRAITVATRRAQLARREPAVDPDQGPPIQVGFVLQHGGEPAPPGVMDRIGEPRAAGAGGIEGLTTTPLDI